MGGLETVVGVDVLRCCARCDCVDWLVVAGRDVVVLRRRRRRCQRRRGVVLARDCVGPWLVLRCRGHCAVVRRCCGLVVGVVLMVVRRDCDDCDDWLVVTGPEVVVVVVCVADANDANAGATVSVVEMWCTCAVAADAELELF